MNARIFRHVIVGVAGATALALGTTALRAQDVVELRLRGRYYSEPATVRITVAVEPNALNRTLVVEADGEFLFRSSAVELDGANGRRLHTLEFKNLPRGYYTVRAEVHSAGERVRGAAEDVLVVGDPGEPHY